ncbi:MAG: adenosylmethionine--8-amino-7-oxononanoate transaminase [Pseudomonadota bacterium]
MAQKIIKPFKENNWFAGGYQHIWHPYTQMQTAPLPMQVIGTDNVYIKLANGQKLIDGISSWWSACHGYNHPYIIEAMKQQLDIMPHIMFAGLAHEPAYNLASKLVEITPDKLNRVFFADSGSVAIEVAMKMSVQYFKNIGENNKSKFIAFKNGYHGDTMGAMSLCDRNNGMHKNLQQYSPGQYLIDIPNDEYSFAEFVELVKSISNNVAGMIIEPLVQGAGGMKFYSADILSAIRKVAKDNNILFIADEIATGFGRTSEMFACEEAGIRPDIMCLGKALTGGTCSLAAVMATDEIFNGFLSDEMTKAFTHGPTYMANPLACIAANASIDLFQTEPRLAQIQKIEQQMINQLLVFNEHPKVIDVRVKGAIGVIELDCEWEDIWFFRENFVKEDVWLRPFNNIIYLMPPFIISEEQLSYLIEKIAKIIKKWDMQKK